MPFTIFENEKELNRAFDIIEENLSKPPSKRVQIMFTGLQGKVNGVHNFVYISSQELINKFDERNIKYRLLNEKEVENYISYQAREYLKNLKQNHPNLLL